MSNYFELHLKRKTGDERIFENLISKLARLEDFLGVEEAHERIRSRRLESVLEIAREEIRSEYSSIYFSSLKAAEAGEREFTRTGFDKIEIFTKSHRDWNSEWRKSFRGADLSPFWKIVPIWLKEEEAFASEGTLIWMNPSLGFGTGEHSTTQICLKALGERGDLSGRKILDFGAGSGILSVAAALKMGRVDAVEIDSLALESARELASLNRVRDRIEFSETLTRSSYSIVLANILKSVLLDFSKDLVSRLDEGGVMILSGLLAEDLSEVEKTYSHVFREKFKREPHIDRRELGDWRGLILTV